VVFGTGNYEEREEVNNKMILPIGIPNLDEFEAASCDLSHEYWTPENKGETRKMFYMGVQQRTVPSQSGGEIDLDCVLFMLPGKDGTHKTVVNGSKRLVAVFQNNEMESGTPVQVTYNGKKKNRTNGNISDDWSVVLLKVKAK
jgi:hypothetical protein